MIIRCTTEEARAFALTKLPETDGVPHSINFDHVTNHLAATVMFAAMGEPGQSHNVGQLYVFFRMRSPDFFSRLIGRDRQATKANAYTNFMLSAEGAMARVAEGKNETILEALQWEMANGWNFDDGPVNVYAVNGDGVAAPVSNIGGFPSQDSEVWERIRSELPAAIDRTFAAPIEPASPTSGVQ